MELLEGKKYRNRNTEKSIIDIKINDDYIMYFKELYHRMIS